MKQRRPAGLRGASRRRSGPTAGGEAAQPARPTGEPFVIGVQNLEGDPNGSFPEFSLAIQAAADYVNAELGGLQRPSDRDRAVQVGRLA